MSIIELLVGLLIFGLFFWIVNIVPQIPAFVKQVITIVIGVICIIWVLQAFGLVGSIHTPVVK